MSYKLLAILAAYLLDLILGDPQVSWHPTRIIGEFIGYLESKLNPVTPALKSGRNGVNIAGSKKKLRGVVLLVLVVGITMFSVFSALKLAKSLNTALYYLVSIFFIYFALSVKSLRQGADKVYQVLKDKDLERARKDLAMLVARDTQGLDERETIRATVETVAESIMDGIIAPLFYAFLGGAALTWAYKAINTLDSMVGYRNEKFIDFGWAAAKLDAVVNFIPAKLTCVAILISSLCLRQHWLNTGKWFLKYFFKGQFYNSEATEAVMAGALGVQLGGLNFYASGPMQKNLIGFNLYPLEIKHIKESIKVTYFASALFMAMGIFLIGLLGRG